MGQDDSCGICGEHYQTCEHACKEHLVNSISEPLCGTPAKNLLYANLLIDMDLEGDLCQRCKKAWMKLAKTDFEEFIDVLKQNAWTRGSSNHPALGSSAYQRE